MKATIALLFVSLILCGCSSVTDHRENFSDSDCGPRPAGAAYRDQIETAIKAFLHDPDSATFNFEEPYKAHYKEQGSSGWQYGWCVKTHVNALNGFGGFAGVEPYWCFLHQGRAMVIVKPTEVAKSNWSDRNPYDSNKYLQ